MDRERLARTNITEHIIVSDDDGARTIIMSRPETRNALTADMYLAMAEAIASAQSDPTIRCLILAGRSGVFATGSEPGKSPQAAMNFLQSLESNQKPVIAAVDGPANGIGTLMVFHCDFVVADATATFSSPLVQHDEVADAAAGLDAWNGRRLVHHDLRGGTEAVGRVRLD